MHTINNKLKALTIVCFMLTTLSCITAYSTPATGYELSIYESTPLMVWVALILSISGGVFILILQVYTKEYEHSKFWLIGLFLLILNRVCLLCIPSIRGYYSWNGDNTSHIGAVRDIFFEGHFANNSYPITHVLMAEILQISGLSIELVTNHSTVLFSVIFVISLYLLSSSVFKTKAPQILIVASIGGVLFNTYDVYIMPNGWSLLYLPIIFYFYFKSWANNNSLQYTILYVILLIFYPFFHPLSATMIIVMLPIIGITKCLLNVIEANKIDLKMLSNFQFTSILIELIIILDWTLSFKKFYPNVRNLYKIYYSSGAPSSINVIAGMNNTLNKIDLSGIDLLELIVRIKGDDFIFLVLSLVSFIILLKSSTEEKKKHENLLILLALTFFFGLMYAGYLFNIIPGIENLGSQRLEAYLVIFTPISAGFVYQHILERRINFKRFNIKPLICLIIIMSASIISIFSLYTSPYVMRPTPEATEMDINGATWLLNYKNSSTTCAEIMSPVYRLADGILGQHSARDRIDIQSSTSIPDNFNYTSNTYLGNSYTEDKYSMITKFDTVIYDTVWKNVGRFHAEDFEKLNFDSTVDKMYSNGETNVYYIHSK